mmetsp:Transcript_6645/g.21504  ORF Transcript_6645/g.21504 Transcript_6645/m.21504 type:complete len:206 (-) Transcript_6645:3506-4123(-)
MTAYVPAAGGTKVKSTPAVRADRTMSCRVSPDASRIRQRSLVRLHTTSLTLPASASVRLGCTRRLTGLPTRRAERLTPRGVRAVIASALALRLAAARATTVFPSGDFSQASVARTTLSALVSRPFSVSARAFAPREGFRETTRSSARAPPTRRFTSDSAARSAATRLVAPAASPVPRPLPLPAPRRRPRSLPPTPPFFSTAAERS